jgi:hypothetical protein
MPRYRPVSKRQLLTAPLVARKAGVYRRAWQVCRTRRVAAASAEETPPDMGRRAHGVGEVAPDLVQDISRLLHQFRGLLR